MSEKENKYTTIKLKNFSIRNDNFWSKVTYQKKHIPHLRILYFLASNLSFYTNICVFQKDYITTKIIAKKLKIHIRNVQSSVRHWIKQNVLIREKGKFYFNPYIQSKGKIFQTKILKKFPNLYD
jgi:hypothetical protein